ncbi:PREDICTED: uncharacterized protein LOC108770661 [Trachymyrmex cornetzi]|uniref:uncharacterized protein LOC108770661 n=1 Tax=Trachymyrmex cornetzi TaxID=471704 RepID=UPI00084F4ED5|nr:PREDICTED: uncharacterized protein LOC108770661 [Trachymyrmex cornetzi]
MTCSLGSTDSLDKNIENFWKLESYDNDKAQKLSVGEKYCEQYFEQTTNRTNDGRFIVRLPFREKNLPIGNNKEIALKRLYQLERRFKGDEAFRKQYLKFMSEYVELNHMSIVNKSIQDSRPIVYLPHHGVFKDNINNTKLRVVFDASAKNNQGVSLNDALLIGPVLQDNLIDIVLRFRFYKVAITADLQKMYRQVLVHHDEREFQRILWRFSPDEPVQEYHLNTVTYGQSCASYLAIRCLRQLASVELEHHPLAARSLLNDTYVDDIITGADTIEDACILQGQLISLLAKGCFEAHKWCSNAVEALDGVPANLREFNTNLSLSNSDVTRTLGLEWNPVSDELQFTVQSLEDASSKRAVLSVISKLFDPLGLVGPVMTTAKILMQGLWEIKTGWDDPLPDAFLNKWRTFQQSLMDVNLIRIPRIVTNISKAGRVIVHGFCDASENAYGACIYIQWKGDTSDEISVGLLCSKAKVAPLKKQSIPRLELCSALLLSKLIVNVKQAIQVKVVETHAWCDSMVVLYWIRGDASRWKSFVSNRVTKIVDNLPAANWRHVKSSENPADLLSRGATPVKIRDNRLWWYGPKWLSESLRPAHGEELHPNALESDMADAEIEAKGRSHLCHLNIQQFSPNESLHRLIQDCSTLTKIERSLAYCLRFLHNCRKEPRDRLRTRLTLQEINESRRMIIKYTQSFYFQEELGNLQGQGQMKASNKLYQLHPFLDENGILRVGGRLQEAPWTFERKHPILLPAKCKITRLIVERAHRLLLHANQQLLLASIRQQYWPLNARSIVRQVCRACIWCVRNNPKGLTQAMGHLPSNRIKPSRAFSVTGIDYAGPIITLLNKGRGKKTCKSYVALFVCFATKAIHLEVVSELSTAASIATLRRFVGRRGVPRKICSDNATNFVGAKRELEEIYSFVRSSINGPANDTLLELGIEWSFIPPYSPHLGGLWEAGVKTCKYHLKRVMGNNLLTFEELSTVLIQIEACLNSRPLAPLSADPLDLQPLTPGHFLTGAPLTSIPEVDLSNIRINRLDRWEAVQRTVQDFWKRWAAEYVANLQGRVKWKTRQENLKENDLVLLQEDNLPSLKWRMGRVSQIHAGKDGLVRVVTVRTANGLIKRSIAKLCKLPMDEKSNKKD